MLQVLPYLSMFVLPILLVATAWLGGAWVLVVPVFVYALLPVLDVATGPDRENRPPAAPTWVYRALPRLYVPLYTLSLAYTLWTATSASPWVAAGLVMASGLVSVLGINVAHELMHRAGKLDLALSVWTMAGSAYPHFVVEHVHGHHRNVATPLDPASARQGESVWAFLPRTLVGGLRSAWSIEAARSGQRWGWGNRIVRWWALQLLGITALFVASPLLGAFFVAQAALSILLLEIINYVEHYGLAREATAPGRWERVRPHHSWNSPERVTNWFLLNLQRHSDHHAYAGRPYEQLRHYDDVPQLPAGYPWMMLVALFPPLWFRVMDARVEGWKRAAAA